MTERIGNDILGYPSLPMSERKKKQLKAKLEEEKEKKKQNEEDDKQKLPDLPIPNDQHTPKLGEHGWDKVAEEVDEQVHVNEHVRRRGRPKKKRKEIEEVV